MNNALGAKLGQKHHSPDLSKDIRKILESLRAKAVYEVKPGRTIENNKPEVPNIATLGIRALAGPLREYNERFEQLRERYKESPLIGSGKQLLCFLVYYRYVARHVVLPMTLIHMVMPISSTSQKLFVNIKT